MSTFCVVTGSRAEYGLLKPLMLAIRASEHTNLQVVASAMHLVERFGNTVREIEQDGFEIDARVDMLLASDAPEAIVKSVGLGLIEFSSVFSRLRPDYVILLGDRFEAIAAAQAALFLKLPIIHLHGGETTEGALDESIRHAITKMAHVHLVSTDTYRKRVIQLGESPDRVFTVGALGVENAMHMELLGLAGLEKQLDFSLSPGFFLVTYHPVTTANVAPAVSVQALLAALNDFPDEKLLITFPNADALGGQIIPVLEAYAAANPERVLLVRSLGQLRYLSALQHAKLAIGNSSSGIIEAPSLGTPTVNIGDRQKGRVQADSVINCAEEHAAITAAIHEGMDPKFLARVQNCRNPYGDGDTSHQILTILERLGGDLSFELPAKPFHDVSFEP